MTDFASILALIRQRAEELTKQLSTYAAGSLTRARMSGRRDGLLDAADEIERAAGPGLPVIRECAECKHCVAYGRPNARSPKRGAVVDQATLARLVAFYACEHDESPRDETGVARVSGVAGVYIPPPDWCPLRRKPT